MGLESSPGALVFNQNPNVGPIVVPGSYCCSVVNVQHFNTVQPPTFDSSTPKIDDFSAPRPRTGAELPATFPWPRRPEALSRNFCDFKTSRTQFLMPFYMHTRRFLRHRHLAVFVFSFSHPVDPRHQEDFHHHRLSLTKTGGTSCKACLTMIS